MGPPGFVECYVCSKQFGSRSFKIHLPQCLARWRKDNGSLPPKYSQSKTPPLSLTLPFHFSKMSRGVMGTNTSKTTTETDNEMLDSTWEEKVTTTTAVLAKHKLRPSTATLEKPKVLDQTLCDQIDMSEMSRQMASLLVLTDDSRNNNSSSDYSSDFNSTMSSPPSSCERTHSSEDEDDDQVNTDPELITVMDRPSTMKLVRPSSHISIPVIAPGGKMRLPRRGKTATIRSRMPLKKRIKMAQMILASKDKINIPEPCLTCGQEEKPERFHSHPLHHHLQKFKAKDKLIKKDTYNIDISHSRSFIRLPVTKPTALRYKSKSLESVENSLERELAFRRNSGKSPDHPAATQAVPFKVKSNSGSERGKPKRWCKVNETIPSAPSKHSKSADNLTERRPLIPLKEFIQKKRKASADLRNGQQNRNLAQSPREMKNDYISSETSENPCMNVKPRFVRPQRRIIAKKVPSIPKPKPAPSQTKDPAYNELIIGGPLRVCYICGREFGTMSLDIHEPCCLEKWQRENNLLPDHLRRADPKKPQNGLTKAEWNEHAWIQSQAQLVPCENCGRTFFPERLEKHLKGCHTPPGVPKKPKNQKQKEEERSTQRDRVMRSARPTLVCYICGREFGSRSISIHEPQCLSRWNLENDKLPINLRRVEPTKPKVVLDESGNVDREAMAEAAWKSHLETLVKCEGCDRTFFPNRLQIHQKSCKNLQDA